MPIETLTRDLKCRGKDTCQPLKLASVISVRSSRQIFKILTAVGGVLGLLMVSSTAAVAVGVPAQPSGVYDDIKHDVARRGGGGGRKAGRGGGRRGGFRRGRGGGRAFRGHRSRFKAFRGGRRSGRAFRGGRGPRHKFRGPKRGGRHAFRGRGPRHGLRGPGRGGRYAHRGGRPNKFSRYWHRRKYARYWRGKHGYWRHLRYGKYRRHKYGYHYRPEYDYGYYRSHYPLYGLPWASYYAGVKTPEELVCRTLYETALIANTPYHWDHYYASCDDPEVYAWFEAYLPLPDLPLRK